jgi:hypothetical protein
MTTLPLPEKSVRLSPTGFSKLYTIVRTNPDAAKTLADEIEADPRGVLERLFKLTKLQKRAIANTSDDVLRGRAKGLLGELRSEAPSAMQFCPKDPDDAGGAATGAQIMGCTCLFTTIV